MIKKFLLLFLFIYALIYCNSIQFVFTFITDAIWNFLVPKFAKLVGETEVVESILTGSGDTIFDYYMVLLMGVISVVLAIVILIIDRKRKDYKGLYNWLLLILRYFVAYQMISYGLAKIFYLQFGPPSQNSLNTLLGDKTPMGLLWTFMGYSKTYCMFTGFAEFLGGILLLSRRTTLLGALVTFGVMFNVMILNYCFDVPVKLLSTHLVVFSMIIAGFWASNLVHFFFLNKEFKAVKIEDVVPEKWRKIKMYIKWILVLIFIGYQVNQMLEYQKQISDRKIPKVAFHGTYDVENFELTRDGVKMEIPPKQIAWDKLIINPSGYAVIDVVASMPYHRTVKTDSTNHTITYLKSSKDSIGDVHTYQLLQGGYVTLNGMFEGDSLSVTLKEKEPFGLTNSKFNWIQQYPNNR